MKKKKKKHVAVIKFEGNLEKHAISQYNAGHYKEAIEIYKKLLQDSDNDEWRQRLAHCYLQRALAFAKRGMVKEAIVLWENHSQYIEPPYESLDQFITWLLLSNNQDKIKQAFCQISADQLDKQYPQLASLLGFLILADYTDLKQQLPQDSAFVAHLKIVETALQLLKDKQLEKVNELIKQLPFRSAFRDIRTLINAISIESSSILQMQSQLARIPAHSPYKLAASLLLSCTIPGSELSQQLGQFNHKQIQIIAEIRQFDKKQRDLISQVAKNRDGLTDKAKFNLAVQFQSLCGLEFAQEFCLALLAFYPAGKKEYAKRFTAIDPFEENRIKALKLERDGNSYEAEFFWKQCIKLLTNKKADNGLKIALILRHIALKNVGEEQVDYLIESLQHDPDDYPTYLKIVGYFSQQDDDSKDYKQWLEKTLQKFPQDIEVLSLAVGTATRKKAYKKASQYAQKILKIDPLNSFAKKTLFSSHLSHARRLIVGKKYHLVEKEISQAEKLKIGKAYLEQTQLMRGLLCYFEQDKTQGLQLIADSISKQNADSTNAFFQASMEALLTGLPVTTLLKKLSPIKAELLDAQKLTRLIEQINHYASADDNLLFIGKALEKIKASLKQAIEKHNFDENLLLIWCQALDSIHHYELIRHCVKIALAQWTKPIWVYYKIYSNLNGRAEKCSSYQAMQLQQNQDLAMQQKDHRAMVLIEAFLEQYYQANEHNSFGFFDKLFDLDKGDDDYEGFEQNEDNFEDNLDELFEHIPESVFNKINKKVVALTKKTTPEKLIKELGISSEKGFAILTSMMMPELYTALMIVKAANELNIDIEVNADDVLECFGLPDKPGSFPF